MPINTEPIAKLYNLATSKEVSTSPTALESTNKTLLKIAETKAKLNIETSTPPTKEALALKARDIQVLLSSVHEQSTESLEQAGLQSVEQNQKRWQELKTEARNNLDQKINLSRRGYLALLARRRYADISKEHNLKTTDAEGKALTPKQQIDQYLSQNNLAEDHPILVELHKAYDLPWSKTTQPQKESLPIKEIKFNDPDHNLGQADEIIQILPEKLRRLDPTTNNLRTLLTRIKTLEGNPFHARFKELEDKVIADTVPKDQYEAYIKQVIALAHEVAQYKGHLPDFYIPLAQFPDQAGYQASVPDLIHTLTEMRQISPDTRNNRLKDLATRTLNQDIESGKMVQIPVPGAPLLDLRTVNDPARGGHTVYLHASSDLLAGQMAQDIFGHDQDLLAYFKKFCAEVITKKRRVNFPSFFSAQSTT
jgi:hypothetical protein